MGYDPNYKANKYVESLIKERESKLKQAIKDTHEYLETKKFYELIEEKKVDFLKSKNGLVLLEGMSKNKIPFVEIASCFGVTQRWLHDTSREHQEIYDAIDRGRADSMDEVEEALNRMAKGYFVTETRKRNMVNERGRKSTMKEDYKKWIPANNTAAQYIMNNKRQMEYRNRQEAEQLAKNTIHLEIEIIGDYELVED
jgi:hypothetical protein